MLLEARDQAMNNLMIRLFKEYTVASNPKFILYIKQENLNIWLGHI